MASFAIPTLTTDRLRLRAFRASDLDAYAAMRGNPEVVRYLGTGRTSTRVEVWRMMAAFLGQWALRGYGVWACDKNRRRCFYRQRRHFPPARLAGTGDHLSLDRPFWRQGFATEAASAARNWLFEHFPLPRVASFIRPDNHASKRVAKRLGAVYERTSEWRGSTYEHWVHYQTAGNS